jgi:uncharacterized repeat protein (TIGR03803 family)
MKGSKMRIQKRFAHGMVIGISVFICMAWALGNPSASQAAFSTLHSFAGGTGDGANGSKYGPGDLTLLGTTLYGMTYTGGAHGCGTIFKINTDGTGQEVLYSFSGGSDGAKPYGSLTPSGTTLFGMTCAGGDDDYGTIFKIETNGTGYQVLRSFTGGSDGSYPFGSLTLAGSTLYGVTSEGGAHDLGTIFKINTDGNEHQVLHSFSGGSSDGAYSYGSLTLAGTSLYGMNFNGGAHGNMGTIFKIDTDGNGYQVMHSFNGFDGSGPFGSFTLSGSTLYAMTCYNGIAGSKSKGTIFRINTDATGYQVLHSFNNTDGAEPHGSLTLAGSTLYGMTNKGGALGYGTIFSMSVTPGAVVPGAPTIGTATAGNALAKVNFTAPTSSGGSAITSYTVTSNPGNITAKGHASPVTVKGLTNGTAYTFTVTATNKIGTGNPSGPSNKVTPATVPRAPTIGLAVPDNASARVNFTLSASDGGSAITLYTAKSYPGGLTATGVGSPIKVTGLTNGKTYTFTVRATNGIGDGPWSKHSNKVKPATIPGAPTIGTATAGNALAKVYFKAPASNGGSRITSYTVTPSEGQAVSGPRSPITVNGLTNGKAYTFMVKATNSMGTGPASSSSNSVTPIAP